MLRPVGAGSPQARKVEASPWLLGRRRRDCCRGQPPTPRMPQVRTCPTPVLSLGTRNHQRPWENSLGLMLREHPSYSTQGLSTKPELWSCLDPSCRGRVTPSPGERPSQGRGLALQAPVSRKSLFLWVQPQPHLPVPLSQPVPHTTQCRVAQAEGPATWPTSSAHWPRTAKAQTGRGLWKQPAKLGKRLEPCTAQVSP